MPVTDSFWRGRRVLLTGHTGFKGAWLHLWLRSMGADVTGLALAPDTQPNLASLLDERAGAGVGDIRDESIVKRCVAQADPQVVIHMAAQALVRESYQDPVTTFQTNVMGTVNVLQACRALPRLQCIVVVTSDKVYQNDGHGRAFAEADRLGGHDPYSNSKACAELVSACFRDSFYRNGPPLATVRAGNVIGGGDWAADRLIPDCVRALEAGAPVRLRNPAAVRPWQHVLEPLSGYLAMAEALVRSPGDAPRTVNFGPDPASFCTVSAVVEAFSARFGGKPGWVADPGDHPPEAWALTLSSALAGRALDWRPHLDMPTALAWTADWYRAYKAGENMLHYSQEQLVRYRRLA
ncbi:MAG: CDP-glucose 4,6-dehydratase [Steroidobacterales bacterium]